MNSPKQHCPPRKSGKVDNEEACRIRDRYFERLGIIQTSSLPLGGEAYDRNQNLHVVSHTSDSSSTLAMMKEGRNSQLKNQEAAPQMTRFDSDQSSVSFDSAVSVHSIPHHLDYSPDIQQALWTPAQELSASVARNRLEFWSEGCDWREVLEEDSFVIRNNELVHPVHCLVRPTLQRQFTKVFWVQQQHRRVND